MFRTPRVSLCRPPLIPPNQPNSQNLQTWGFKHTLVLVLEMIIDITMAKESPTSLDPGPGFLIATWMPPNGSRAILPQDGDVCLIRADTCERVGTYQPQLEKGGAVYAVRPSAQRARRAPRPSEDEAAQLCTRDALTPNPSRQIFRGSSLPLPAATGLQSVTCDCILFVQAGECPKEASAHVRSGKSNGTSEATGLHADMHIALIIVFGLLQCPQNLAVCC